MLSKWLYHEKVNFLLERRPFFSRHAKESHRDGSPVSPSGALSNRPSQRPRRVRGMIMFYLDGILIVKGLLVELVKMPNQGALERRDIRITPGLGGIELNVFQCGFIRIQRSIECIWVSMMWGVA